MIGGPQPGSELSWAGVFVPRSANAPVFSATIATDMLVSLGYWRPLAPNWDLSQFQFTAATLEGLMPMHGLYDASDPDLSAFARRRGKLLIWHGWSDPHISPINSETLARGIVDRTLAMLVKAAVDAVYMRVASPADIETAMTKGVNYPKGLLAWGDEIGPRVISSDSRRCTRTMARSDTGRVPCSGGG